MTLKQNKSRLFIVVVFLLLHISSTVFAQTDKVTVEKNDAGMKLVVNGKDFMVNGMNWDYFPIGTNFSYSLWNQPDDVIKPCFGCRNGITQKHGCQYR